MEDQTYVDVLTGSQVARTGGMFARIGAAAGATHAECVFFPGCSIVNFAPELLDGVYRLLREHGVADGISFLCCGKLLAFEPEAETVIPAFRRQFACALAERGVRRIVTACPNCTAELRTLIEREGVADVEVVVLPQLLAELGVSVGEEDAARFLAESGVACAGRAPRLAVHDSCPDRKTGEFARGVRALLPEGLLVEMEHNHASSRCCGSLAKAAGKDELATRQAVERGEEGRAAGADALVTVCMSCASQLSFFQESLPVFHYLEILLRRRIDWKNLPPYLSVRFLFEPHEGRRAFEGLT